MIPPEKSAVVSKGLIESFGTATIDHISRMTRGLSSDLVFRIVVDGSPYLLRIITRLDEISDPQRQFTAMNLAAAAGIAPRVFYTNAIDGISITDFVEAVPLAAPYAFIHLPRTLRRLHAVPPFPKEFNYLTMHKGFIWRFRSVNPLSSGDIEEVFNRYQQLCAVYPRLEEDIVSCHSDLKPENILFDGGRIWLVDWQAAFLNDRFFDLSVVANFLANSEADERAYLEHYFGHPPDELQSARFFLMRQAVHMFYATVFLLLGAAGKPIEPPENLPTFEDFHRSIWSGEIDLASNPPRIVYGLLHWQRLIQNIRQSRFDESLRIVSARNQYGAPLLFPSGSPA